MKIIQYLKIYLFIHLIQRQKIFYKYFNTYIEAAKFFDCSTCTLSRYLNKNKLYKNKLYKNQWILLSSEQKQ